MVAREALPSDGVSRTYPAPDLRADPKLLALHEQVVEELGLEAHTGCIASVDALYREHEELLERWRQRGATAINMETSPLYAAARTVGLPALWLGQVSDELHPGRPWLSWHANRELRMRARETSRDIIVALMQRLSRDGTEAQGEGQELE